MGGQLRGGEIRIVLFTDEPQLALGTTCALERDGGFHVCCTVMRAADLLPSMTRLRPDLGLLDFDPRTTPGLLALLRDAVPECRIALWTRVVTPEVESQASQWGVWGVVHRTCSNSEMAGILRRIAAGERVPPDAGRTIDLTRRERQLVTLLSQGMKNREIAACLAISEGSVRIYLTRLFQKVGARDRFELALFGLRDAARRQAHRDGAGADDIAEADGSFPLPGRIQGYGDDELRCAG